MTSRATELTQAISNSVVISFQRLIYDAIASLHSIDSKLLLRPNRV